MTLLTLDASRDGLADLPDGYEPVARDDLGDVLAADRDGKVWLFPHGAGDWNQRSLAFASRDALHEYVAFQPQLVVVGRFVAPWTEARVAELLQPIVGENYRLHCREAPPSW